MDKTGHWSLSPAYDLTFENEKLLASHRADYEGAVRCQVLAVQRAREVPEGDENVHAPIRQPPGERGTRGRSEIASLDPAAVHYVGQLSRGENLAVDGLWRHV
jgi:hypothetical protein